MIVKVTVFLLLGCTIYAGGLQALDYHASRLENLGTLYIHNDIPVPDSAGGYTSACTKDGCVGRVWIYYSDAKRTPQWGTIDKNGVGKYAEHIICRQLGYTGSNKTATADPLLDTIPVWLKNIKCGEEPQIDGNPDYARYKNNILQCEAEVCDDCFEHIREDLVLSCNGQLYKTDTDYYDGQVYLEAPTLKPYGMQTTMGIIKIFLNRGARAISLITASGVATNFTYYKRDSLCKQMGFTAAATGSVFTMSALSSQFTFVEHGDLRSWFSVNDLKEYCNGEMAGSTPCFGCCFEYPPDQGCDDHVCLEENTLVISCVYEQVNEYIASEEKGNEDKCKFQNKKKLSVCSINDSEGFSGEEQALLILLLIITTLLFVITLCLVGWRIILYRRKRNYDNINDVNEPN